MKRLDLTGERFGRLTVTEMFYGNGKTRARCVCLCGGETKAFTYNLRNGNTSSCGCLAAETSAALGRKTGAVQGKRNATHGKSRTRTYSAWRDAKNRCFRKKTKSFEHYGERGITMCDEWAKSFKAFLSSLGECPPGMTLERVNVELGYHPGNCRWATRSEQAQNKRNNAATWEIVRAIRHERGLGVSRPRLAAKYGMSPSNVYMIDTGRTWKEDRVDLAQQR